MPDLRASDHSRDHAAERLRNACVAGAIGLDTFERRLELTLRARTLDELRLLTDDLPVRPPPTRPLTPPAGATQVVLGRSSACDVVIDADTVSRHHATLRLQDGRWRVFDLDSLNGTHVNGVCVERAYIEAGDRLQLGEVTLVFAP